MLFAQKNKPRKQQAQTKLCMKTKEKCWLSFSKGSPWIKTKFLWLTTERKVLIQGIAEKDIFPEILNMSINCFELFETTIVTNQLPV